MGRILVIELSDQNTSVFKEIIKVLERNPDFELLQTSDKTVMSFPMLDIFFKQRKVFSGQNEIALTKKEFDLLCLLAVNRNLVITYEQIYEKLWNEAKIGNISNTVGCHVRSLCRKLLKAIPNAVFDIQCVRSVGYRFEIK